jgi:hypothetical protein
MGVRVVFCGHEHNFQHSLAESVHYFVTGGGGKVSIKPPQADRFDQAFTNAWASEGHFLLVEVNGPKMTVMPMGGLSSEGTASPIVLRSPSGQAVPTPIVITST